jgi:GNAT superfamily N-acetyltransferase
MSEQSIRRALPADAEGFVRAHEASWDATIGAIVGKSLGELAPFADRVARFRAGVEEPPPHTGVWVAERDGEIVGIAVRSGAELRDLYVVPEAWRRGVANELMEAALADIRGDDSAEASSGSARRMPAPAASMSARAGHRATRRGPVRWGRPRCSTGSTSRTDHVA